MLTNTLLSTKSFFVNKLSQACKMHSMINPLCTPGIGTNL